MDLRQIKNLMKEFEDSKIHKLEINDSEFSIKLEKESVQAVAVQSQQVVQSAPLQQAQPQEQVEPQAVASEYAEVKAPLVGTFYQSPSPDSEPFVSLGSKVNKGDTLFIVEAMKVMNEITSPVSGTVRSINVKDATMVEFGQVIMEIEE